MTIQTPSPPVVVDQDPSSLVDPAVFDHLARHFAAVKEVTLPYAKRALGQFLIFLKAHADQKEGDPEFGMLLPDGASYRVVPTTTVDAVWHTALQDTEPYAAACETIAGGFVHHRPIVTREIENGTAKAYTMMAIRATGYAIDEEFWDGAAESCCPPNPCV